MLFNSNIFMLVFLPVTLGLFFLLGKEKKRQGWAISWLVIASLFFYGYWNASYLYLIIISVLANYITGTFISRDAVKKQHKKIALALGVAANLSAIGYYKYTNFLVYNLNEYMGIDLSVSYIALPLAISFFTFQQIAYLCDSYNGETKGYSFLDYALFVMFFPQLIAGPIVHHGEVVSQFRQGKWYKFNSRNLAIGFSIFVFGLFKKVVLADGISVYATPVFAMAESGEELSIVSAWAGALAYTFQLYFDFSGYSDMAIGLARMFSIKLSLNFYSPYKSVNIIDFWRTWHITLSDFLRRYLYIPLGGNKKGPFRRYINLMITMFLGGIWQRGMDFCNLGYAARHLFDR